MSGEFLNFETLPEELIIEIISKCSSSDILSSSLVSKRFNNIIKNSSRILNKLTIYFPNIKHPDYYDDIPNCNQMKMSASFISTKAPVECFHSSLTRLTICYATIYGSCLSKMLIYSCNLKYLELIQINYLKESKKLENLPELKNLNLILDESFVRLLKVLKKCEVKSLTLKNYKITEMDELQKFLKNQRKLKELNLINIKINLFYDGRFDKVNFKLEKLRIEKTKIPNNDHFVKFLSNHYESLKCFEILNADIPNFREVLMKFKNLNELNFKLNTYVIDNLPIMKNIMKMTLNRKRILKRWFEKFPNVKRFKNE
ncbi:hypothetical protein PVAND_016658 [Polypedilum vanderplanki]|uniref:F-box domain-containing protein n=1 Tax=Polypedilum vanderplanki TaxID=319348 RepID=A0A9J6BGT7_POLVA|nr:hypothetical protein PVAND_016658 [Polypedilum vanderplanki]